MSKMVVALGGNALGKTPEEQLKLVKNTARSLVGLVKQGHEVVVSHGNGPQVGAINLGLNYAAENGQGAAFPFPECGAMSQGYIGYHLQQSLQNELNTLNIDKEVATVVTQVVVDKEDEAFSNLTKPVGMFYDKETADKISAEKGYQFVEDAGRGYRRVVASPQPINIVEYKSIEKLIQAGTLVVAVGGGGIPVIDNHGQYEGVPAVIDKDKSSALLAEKIEADQLVILTAVDNVFINFGKEDEKKLTEVTVDELKQYIAEEQFAKGSMLPKIEACIDFVEKHPEGTALITSLDHLDDALEGKVGTLIKK